MRRKTESIVRYKYNNCVARPGIASASLAAPTPIVFDLQYANTMYVGFRVFILKAMWTLYHKPDRSWCFNTLSHTTFIGLTSCASCALRQRRLRCIYQEIYMT